MMTQLHRVTMVTNATLGQLLAMAASAPAQESPGAAAVGRLL